MTKELKLQIAVPSPKVKRPPVATYLADPRWTTDIEGTDVQIRVDHLNRHRYFE